MTGLFAQWQPRYAERGIATFPVNEKRPAVSHYLNAGIRASGIFAQKFPDSDALGFACKQNDITVLDVDSPDENLLADALNEFGPSPIIVRSGSGNFQAWYRRNGEGRSVRPDDNRPIDILGGGFVVAPPSHGSKGPYRFLKGSLDDLGSLPCMTLPEPDNDDQTPLGQSHGGNVQKGARNATLWRESMKAARGCSSFDELLIAVRSINLAKCSPPLPDSEVISCAASAWEKQRLGQNWVGGGRRVDLRPDEIDGLMHDNPDAFVLLMKLRRHHWGREFIVANAMCETMSATGWRRQRFSRARKYLERIGAIKMVRKPIKGIGPAVYKFGVGNNGHQ